MTDQTPEAAVFAMIDELRTMDSAALVCVGSFIANWMTMVRGADLSEQRDTIEARAIALTRTYHARQMATNDREPPPDAA